MEKFKVIQLINDTENKINDSWLSKTIKEGILENLKEIKNQVLNN